MVLEWLCQNLVVALCFLWVLFFFLLFVLKEKKLVLSINKVGCQVVVAGDRRVK